MKITSIGLENFKGISEYVTIPISPITLLFGANGSGKSTVLHAFLYLYELIVNDNPNPDYATLNGGKVELGGFKSLIHKHDLNSDMRISVKLDVSDVILDSPLSPTDEYILEENNLRINEPNISEIDISIVVSYDKEIGVYVKEYNVDSDTVIIGKIISVPWVKDIGFSPSVEDFLNTITNAYGDGDDVSYYRDIIGAGFGIDGTQTVSLKRWTSALPINQDKLSFGSNGWDASAAWEEHPLAGTLLAENIFSQLMVEPFKLLKKKLKEIVHLGPLRIVPERGYVPKPKPDDWYTGAAGWDRLAYSNSDFQNKINLVFGEKGFDSSYKFLTDGAYLNIKIKDEKTNTKHEPSALGVGVSQVLPFVVGACDPRVNTFFVEQPELHIHPKWQLTVADILIQSIKENPNKLIFVETHSEHLMLRLLNRMRLREDEEGFNKELSIRPEDISVVCVYSHENKPYYQRQTITPNGDFELDWPEGFFEERYGEI